MDRSIRNELESLLGDGQVSFDDEDRIHYGRDWLRFYDPKPSAIVFPKGIEDVVRLIGFANQYKVPMIPSGGRTGLSGGATATNGEIILSLQKMNRIHSFNAVDRSLVCEAGVVTAAVQEFAEQKGLMYPIDFASAGSSQIGGNIATNAGGIKVIRYGLTRSWITGLKVVTGKGEILNLNKGLTKNATGYDFRNLFIGSEGTLGVIVEATISLARAPGPLVVMFLAVPRLGEIMNILTQFQQRVDLTAFEFLSDEALSKVLDHGELTPPFKDRSAYYALLEFEDLGSNLQFAMSSFEACLAQGWAIDGIVSQSESQRATIWKYRENISEAITRYSPYKNDLSVKVSCVPEFLEKVGQVVTEQYPAFQLIWFGHIGDGNLHLNILKPAELDAKEFKRQCEVVNREVFKLVKTFDGSISAEHGVGLLKKEFLDYSRSESEISYMREVKRIFDPNGILNPGKIF